MFNGVDPKLSKIYATGLQVFGLIAFPVLYQEADLGRKVLLMWLSGRQPDEAVIFQGFAIGISIVVLIVLGAIIIGIERRHPTLAVRRSPAEAREALGAPAWFEKAHAFANKLFGG